MDTVKSINNLILEQQLELKTRRIEELEKEKEEIIKRLKFYENNESINSIIKAGVKLSDILEKQKVLEARLQAYKEKTDAMMTILGKINK